MPLRIFVIVSATVSFALASDADRRSKSPSGRDVIFYDYVEDGELRGGRVQVQLGNPLHHAVDGAQVETGGLNTEQIVVGGDPANRVNVVVVGDGYTAPGLPTYALHADDVVTNFFNEDPFDDYGSYFNVYRVDVISNESGVDEPDQGIMKDTALDMTFNCSGIRRLLCINVGAALQAANNAPARDQVLALANSTRYGGAGYSSSDLGTLAGNNGSAVEIALHEFGHSFADLADEYDYGGPATYTGPERPEANVSILTEATMAAQQTKWAAWLDAPAVGTFEGAQYSEFGIYRPTGNSKMRALNQPFDPINVEQIILEIYDLVDPIDAISPFPGPVSPTDVLEVTPMAPTSHALDVTWQIDGEVVTATTPTSMDLAQMNLPFGTHTIRVDVVDSTDRVRDEALRASRMTSSAQWTVTIACDTAADCCDTDGNGIRDDACLWCACGAACTILDLPTFADMGGSFGDCNVDGFTNIHDRNLALACFADTTSCDKLNIDAGGDFGDCEPDGFCNLHDANHALLTFNGTSTCTCGPSPDAPDMTTPTVGATGLVLVARKNRNQRSTFEVDILTTAPLAGLQSYQLHIETSGGTAGALAISDLVVTRRKDAALPPQYTFSAANLETQQVLAGIDFESVVVEPRAYLATIVLEASPDAAGDFVVDVRHDRQAHTALVDRFVHRIALTHTQPAIIFIDD
jgi:hypothetical protein